MHSKNAMMLISMKDSAEASQNAIAEDTTVAKKATFKPVVVISLYSKGAGQAWVSKHWWKEQILKTAALVISLGVGIIAGKFIANSLSGRTAANVAMANVFRDEDVARQMLDFAY